MLQKVHGNPTLKWGALGAITAIVFVLEVVLRVERSGSLLFTIVIWAAAVQGSIAMVAVTDVVGARWFRPFKKHLLSLAPMLLLLAVMTLFLWPQLDVYPWSGEEGRWLNKPFSMTRNAGMMFVVYAVALALRRASLAESAKKAFWGVLYLFAFVISQSLIAFDLVMSLEYPWISTLFGGYFFIEAMYMGLATAGITCFTLVRKNKNFPVGSMRDTSTLIFGFSLLWVGLFYAQFLVIWYGNLPEEAVFLLERHGHFSMPGAGVYVLACLFVLPFTILLSKRIKMNRYVLLLVSFILLTGVGLERLVFLFPCVDLGGWRIVLEGHLVGLFYFLTLRASASAPDVEPEP
jgi:hypothetical protein